MFGVKVLLNALALTLVICALMAIWVDNPACGVFVARCIATMFILMALITVRETARL